MMAICQAGVTMETDDRDELKGGSTTKAGY